MQAPEEVVGRSSDDGSLALVQSGLDGEAGGLVELLCALQATWVGDFSVRMAGDRLGIMGKIADTLNEIVGTNQRMVKQIERVGQVVGREGRTRQRVRFGLSEGAWDEMESSVNSLIEETQSLAIVLMDIMMPEMDGYQTIEKIRQKQAYRRLPIIALTVKAVKSDGEKCVEAGTPDYLAKPVNTEQLLSALRMWLHRWVRRP